MNKRMLYVATPKSASTSIRKHLRSIYGAVDIQKNIYGAGYHRHGVDSKTGDLSCLDGNESPIILGFWKPPLWWLQAEEQKAYYQDDVVFSPDFYKWTVVRNPWHRLASTYEYLNNRRHGCYEQDLGGIDFATFVQVVTGTPVPDVCQHEKPQRYASDQTSHELLDSLAAIDSFTMRRLGAEHDTVGVKGIGCLWALWPYAHVMKKCSKETSVHTQRWENSVLFPGYTKVGFPDYDVCRDALIEPAKNFDEDTQLRRTILNSPSLANVSRYSENWTQPHTLDKVVRFESLTAGIEEVCSDLGVDTWDLPHLNNQKLKDKNRWYEKMYEGNDSLINSVRNWYRYEITTFGYEFGTYL